MRFAFDQSERDKVARDVAISRAIAGYRSRLAIQADEVATLGDRASEKGALEELARWGHRLHGTAGSFGISSVATAAEQLSIVLQAQGTAQEIKDHVERLASCMRNALSTEQ